MRHLPFMWKFRLLRAIHAGGRLENRRLLAAWERAEGSRAQYNPLDTTQPWPGATDYNSAHVKNYPTGAAGIAATAATLTNGYYAGIVADLRDRKSRKTAAEIVTSRRAEFETWGTNADTILHLLGG